MAVPLVPRVNPNGNIGMVPLTSKAAREYPAPPSERKTAYDAALAHGVELPALNASTDAWREFAAGETAGDLRLDPETAGEMNRDQLVDHFTITTESQED